MIIKRLRCTKEKCRKIHHELPDMLMPYKRHCAETIESIIAGKLESVPCDNNEARGIKKWWDTMRPYFLMVALSLNAKHGTEFDDSTPPREIVRAVANSHLWLHTRSAVMPAGDGCYHHAETKAG